MVVPSQLLGNASELFSAITCRREIPHIYFQQDGSPGRGILIVREFLTQITVTLKNFSLYETSSLYTLYMHIIYSLYLLHFV